MHQFYLISLRIGFCNLITGRRPDIPLPPVKLTSPCSSFTLTDVFFVSNPDTYNTRVITDCYHVTTEHYV